MNAQSTDLKPGVRIRHAELGDGVVIAAPVDGFIKAFFPIGQWQVPVGSLTSAIGRSEIVVSHAKGEAERALRAWLCYQAHALPLICQAEGVKPQKAQKGSNELSFLSRRNSVRFVLAGLSRDKKLG